VGEAVPPTAARFVQRNRLIAALAAVTVVVEAAARSGALVTAAVARRLGRAVLAVPGDLDRRRHWDASRCSVTAPASARAPATCSRRSSGAAARRVRRRPATGAPGTPEARLLAALSEHPSTWRAPPGSGCPRRWRLCCVSSGRSGARVARQRWRRVVEGA